MIVAQGPGPNAAKAKPTPTASTAPASTPGGVNPGGVKQTAPDLTSLLTSDPGYIQAKTAYTGALGNATGALGQGVSQALINFGAVPDLNALASQFGLTPQQVTALTGAISPGAAGLAQQYTQSGDSVLAKLNQAHGQALDALKASLAGRGMLESGATGIGTRLEDQNYQQGMASAYQQLMGILTGDYGNYTNSINAAQGNLATAAGDAYSRAEAQAAKNPSAYIPPPAPIALGPGAPIVTPAAKTAVDTAAVAAGQPISEHGLGMGAIPAIKKASKKSNPYLGPH